VVKDINSDFTFMILSISFSSRPPMSASKWNLSCLLHSLSLHCPISLSLSLDGGG